MKANKGMAATSGMKLAKRKNKWATYNLRCGGICCVVVDAVV